MLAKDYRTRCTLDAIVIDDWVTFEGSEPLFDIIDFSGTGFPEFLAFAEHDDAVFADSYHILIMDHRWVNRTMLSQKISSIHHAVCACLATEEEVMDMVLSAKQHAAGQNFDYIFIEVTAENNGVETIKAIRAAGYKGRLIAVNYSLPDSSALVGPDAADCQVRFPVPVRDITKILSTDAFEEVQTLQRSDSQNSGVSFEDIDTAITYNADGTSVVVAAGAGEGAEALLQREESGDGDGEGMEEEGAGGRPSLGSVSVDQEVSFYL